MASITDKIYPNEFVGPLEQGGVRWQQPTTGGWKNSNNTQSPVSNTVPTSGSNNNSGGGSNLDDLYRSQEEKARQQRDEQKKRANEIGNAWNPIFSELDRQLGSIPQRQQQYEDRINESTQAQLEDVEASRARSTEVLETEKARGLRNLEEDVRNTLDAAGRKIGVLGAGSSSAVGQASEAIARVGQKARGNLMETVTTQLADINNLASEQRSKINQWKGDKLFEITSYFGNKLDELNMQKANAQKERKYAVEELIYNAEQDFVNALRNLDSQVLSYAQTVDMWQRERSAALEDYAKRQGANAAATPAKVAEAISIFNALIEQGMTPEAAQEWMTAQGIYTLPDGIGANPVNDPDSVYDVVSQGQAPATGSTYDINQFADLFEQTQEF